MIEVFDVVRTVMAVRAYQDKPIPEATIRRIVEAGHLTASSQNGQPWHFIVVQNRATLSRLGQAVETGPYISQAPLAIVVAIEPTAYAISDASRAIQSMILTAWSEGIASNWSGFMKLSAIKPILEIPDTLDVLAVIPFGYPAKVLQGKKKRKLLAEIAHRERFTQPFESEATLPTR